MASQNNVPPTEMEELLNGMQDNCRAVEDLALDTIYSQHVPLLNSMRCLTKADCWNILNKYRCLCNVGEQSILLIALTDFITCVCANSEMFPLFVRKYDKNGIRSLLMLLQSHWSKFFSCITLKDITARQMTSVVILMKHCANRVSNTSNKIFLDVMLKMAETTLLLLKNPPDDFVSKYKTLKAADTKAQDGNKTKKTHTKNIENRIYRKPKVAKIPSHITKCVLKPCEIFFLQNNVSANVQETASQRMSEDQGSSESPTSNELKASSAPHKETVLKPKLITDLEAPVPKKKCLEENLINGKVNAFKRLMSNSKKTNLKELSTPQEANSILLCKKEPRNAFNLMMQNANKRKGNQK